jgi:hypothetical protein
MCEIHVGQEPVKAVFHVHEAVLVGASPFFKAALNGSFIEATSKKLFLPSEQAAVFSGILKAIYSGTSTGILDAFCHKTTGSTALQVAGRPVFVELWLSLDRLQLNDMKATFMSFLNSLSLSNFSGYVSVAHVVHVYQNTCHKSPLRSLMLKALVPTIIKDPTKMSSFQYCADEIPELGMELAGALAQHAHEAEQKKKSGW